MPNFHSSTPQRGGSYLSQDRVGLCRLPEEVVIWRRQAALEALAPLIRLLGGKAFSSTGIHQPLLNEASLMFVERF